MQAFTPLVQVATYATRHFATFGLAPAAAQVLWCLVRAEEQGDDEDDEDEEEKTRCPTFVACAPNPWWAPS